MIYLKFYRLSDATFYDRINTIYHFIKPFLDQKCLFVRNMEPLKSPPYISFEDMLGLDLQQKSDVLESLRV